VTRASAPAASAGAPVLALTPAGALVLREEAGAEPVDRVAAERIRAAFARGAGHGLLHLGAAEVDAALPPGLAFWRDVGRAFVTQLCAQPDLEAARGRLSVPVAPAEAAALVAGAPPMPGGEYLDGGVLRALWEAMSAACRAELGAFDGTVEAYLQSCHPAWHLVGRVHFHLAENRGEPDAPFAFLATYSTRLGGHGRPRHRPLGEAIREYAGAGNRPRLLAVLEPVQRAAGRSPFLRELVDAGDVYRPLALSPDDAYRFLRDVPVFEEAGVVVRVPDWWAARRPPRPEVSVTVGARAPSGLGADALLDFDVRVTLDGQPLTAAEIERIAASTEGLALIRGKWVELDPARLRQALEHWRKVQAVAGRDGLGFIEGMRLLSGAALGGDAAPPPGAAEWSRVAAGPWLAQALDALRGPEGLGDERPPRGLRAELRPYQRVGARWLSLLHGLRLGACLADDMGLGKTIQVLALLLARKERASPSPGAPALLVAPASLVANWTAEIDRFAPGLRVLVAHASDAERAPGDVSAADLAGRDLVITTYGLTHRLRWLAETEWPLLILDEAQAIKNPGAKQTRAVKALRAQSRIALTGTPVENRLGDLWSLFDFLNPGLLGSARAFTAFTKRLGERPGGFAALRELTRPYILRRLKSDRRIIADLPEKTELRAYCGLSRMQAALYQEAVRSLAAALERLDPAPGIERRGVVLASLTRLKQICNHPSQWLRDGAWAPASSGKFLRLGELAEVIADKQEKALVFTQFQEVTAPLAAYLAGVFGRPGLVMHGGTPVRDRRELVARFQDDAGVPFFVLSLKVGGTGLNLTAASHVIHFDRWWNPAVEDQATDRAFRIGQRRNVLVHKFVCRGTVEDKIDALIEGKQRMAREVLAPGGEALLTEMSDAELLRVVALDLRAALEAA
jgi:non-specific serine/threonine protein kinase